MKKQLLAITILVIILVSSIGVVACSKSGGGLSNKHVKDYFYSEDIFHDQAGEYFAPLQPTKADDVTIRIKVKRGLAQSVNIKYSFDLKSSFQDACFYTAKMYYEKTDVNKKYDYWVGAIPKNQASYRYHFELKNKAETVWFDTEGVSDEEPYSVGGDWFVIPDFHVPEWSQGAIWYSIMPDSFYNKNTLNDKTGGRIDNPWGGVHASASEYFGGDMLGLMSKVDYLSGLNVTASFINPIWVTQHNAGYGAYDMFGIDSAYGSDELFEKYITALHDSDIKIMLDAVIQYVNVNNIVYNVTGRYPKLYDGQGVVLYDEDGNPIDSGWGGPIVDFSKKVSRDYFYSSDESVIMTYILKYAIDAWRMDIGNTLRGSDIENWGTATQILADIRPYIKKASEEVLYISEHAEENQLTDGILDGKWNYSFLSAVENWVSDISNASNLSVALRTETYGVPRNVANANYNHLTSHDYQRLFDKLGHNVVKFASAELIQMTYIGSPVIYYGEEIGLERPGDKYFSRLYSFDQSMNWDESTWNWYLYNFVSSMTELRKEYNDEYTTGAYMELYAEGANNPYDIFAYARFNDDACITLVNKNDVLVKDFELDVTRLSIKDGTLLTDYLTGRTYRVNKGKVVIDINPVGAVLVTGKSGAYRNEYNICGNGSGSFVSTGESVYAVIGEQSLNRDSKMLCAKGFNNYAIASCEASKNGGYALIIKDVLTNDYYAIAVEDGNAKLVINDKEIAEVKLNDAKDIKVARTSENVLRTYFDGKEVKSFANTLDFGYEILLGVLPLKGETSMKLVLEKLPEQTGSDFEKSLGSGAIVFGDRKNVTLKNGKLEILGNEQETFVVNRGHYIDFTHKAKVDYVPIKPGDVAGLTVMQSEDDYIVVGRYFNGSKTKLVIGQVVNGKLCVYDSVDDVIGELTLQMQKTGAKYKGLYSIDEETYYDIGEVYVNYSSVYAGVVNSGDSNLMVDYWCYGSSTTGEELADNYYVGDISFKVNSKFTENTFGVLGGEWKYVKGGIAQTDDDARNTLYNYTTKKISDFTSTFTVNLTAIHLSEKAYFGVTFARSVIDDIDGYQIKIYADGKVKLVSKDGGVLKEGQTSLKEGRKITFNLIVRKSVLALYEKDNPDLILYYDGLTDTNGYFAWLSNNVAYELYNYNVFEPGGNIFIGTGSVYNVENEIKESLTDLELSNATYNYATMQDIAVSDFAVSYNLMLSPISSFNRGYFDFAFGVTAGAPHLRNGIAVRINTRGQLSIFINGAWKLENTATSITNVSSCYVLVVYQNRKLSIYTANYKEEGNYSYKDLTHEYSYTDKTLRSGTFGFFTYNANVRLGAIRGHGLGKNENFMQLDLYKNMVLSMPMPPIPEPSIESGKNYRNDFTDKKAYETLIGYSGVNYIKNGHLFINGYEPTNWDAGVGIASGKYTDFELKMRFKILENIGGGAWVGMQFAKPSVGARSQFWIVMYPGNVGCLYYKTDLTGDRAVGVADAEGFVILTLRVKDRVITWNLGGAGGRFVADENDDMTGYISLSVGNNRCEYDWVEITVL